jgi:hypothetical protein
MKCIYLFALAFWLVGDLPCVGQVLFGVQGGIQQSGIALTPGSGDDPIESLGFGDMGFSSASLFTKRIGFQAGLMADIPITDRLSVRPKLLYSTKGYRLDPRPLLNLFNTAFGIEALDLPDSLVQPAVVNYLELPVQLMYGFDVGPGRIVLGAGPYAAYALSGSFGGQAITFAPETPRLDYGATLSVGYELPMGLTLSAYYSHGMANLAGNTPTNGSLDPNDPEFNPSLSVSGGTFANRTFGFTVGFFFGAGGY